MLWRHYDPHEWIAGSAVDALEIGRGRIDLRHAEPLAAYLPDHRFARRGKFRKRVVQPDIANRDGQAAVSDGWCDRRQSRQRDRIRSSFRAKCLRRELTWSGQSWRRRLRAQRGRVHEQTNARADTDRGMGKTSEHSKKLDSPPRSL